MIGWKFSRAGSKRDGDFILGSQFITEKSQIIVSRYFLLNCPLLVATRRACPDSPNCLFFHPYPLPLPILVLRYAPPVHVGQWATHAFHFHLLFYNLQLICVLIFIFIFFHFFKFLSWNFCQNIYIQVFISESFAWTFWLPNFCLYKNSAPLFFNFHMF